MYRSLNPATGELLEEFPPHSDAESEGALDLACRRFEDWRSRSAETRASILDRTADLLEARASEYGALMALEMGKPLVQGVAEARKSAHGCRWFGRNGPRLLAGRTENTDGAEAEIRLDPLGPVLGIMPWNFPFWQFFRFAAPALVAGNAVLLKHAPSTPRCALAIERLALEAGFPDGLVRNLFLSDAQAARLIADERLRGVSLTGSTRAGRQVAQSAGRSLKTMVMELGGSDPFIVFEDADLDEAVAGAVAARCQNSGQSCIAAKRFVVHRGIMGPFVESFTAAMEAQKVGDPMVDGVDVGPLARADLRENLARQVDVTIAAGARALCGGRRPEGRGFFYPPTVLADVLEESPAWEEETFGPVAPVFGFSTDEEALRIANASRYGLGASLWTRDLERARGLAPWIEAGSVFVNGMVRSDPSLPFGGVKQSGFGRELAREGLAEFVNVKTVWVRRAG